MVAVEAVQRPQACGRAFNEFVLSIRGLQSYGASETMAAELKLSRDQMARQAISAIGGYTYQLYLTASAWLALGPDEILFVEVAEDFAVMAGQVLQTFQVKNAPSKVITLHHESVVKTLNGWWANRASNPELEVNVTYLTTAAAGRERGLHFPNHSKGLDYWSLAAKGADLAPVRKALGSLDLSSDLAAWVAETADQALRENMLQRVTWLYGGDNLEQRRFKLRRAVRERPGMRLATDDVARVSDATVLRVLEVASGQASSRLTAADLDAVYSATASVTLSTDQLRRLAGGGDAGFSPPLYLPEREHGSGRLYFFGAKDRIPLVGRDAEQTVLRNWLSTDAVFSWTLVMGPGGSGKSRLALELCLQTGIDGWAAGFLPMASVYGAPARFIQFRPEQPTLLVIDYAGDNPAQVGDLIRVLCERSAADDLGEKVRVLLLDRDGPGGSWWRVLLGTHERFMTSCRGEVVVLAPLSELALKSILRHASKLPGEDLGTGTLEALKALDPSGRPLFAALAGAALRQGRKLRDFDRRGLFIDVLGREEKHWRRFARSDQELHQHFLACALSIMTSEIDLPSDAAELVSPALPFSEQDYNSDLIAAITGRDGAFRVAP